MAPGAKKVALKAGLPLRHALRSITHNGIPDFYRTCLRISRDIAQRNAQQLAGIAGHANVDELAGLERGCETRGQNDEREDAIGDLLVRDDLEIVHARR